MKFLLTFLFLVILFVSFSQKFSFKRVTHIEGQSSGGDDIGYGVAYDHEKSIYTVGKYAGSADFDPGPGTTIFSTNWSGNAFIQKLDSSGNFLWANDYGAGYVRDVCVTKDSCVLITGRGIIANPSNGYVFLAKIDGDGNLLWNISFGGSGVDVGHKVCTDSSGNIYLTGYSISPIVDYDAGPGIQNVVSNGGRDIWVEKLDQNGNYIWSRHYGGSGNDECLGICVSDNLLYLTGLFEETVDFNPLGGGDFLTSMGSSDIFVQQLDLLGNVQWTKTIGGSDYDRANDVCIDESNGAIIVGSFRDIVDFDPSNLNFILESTYTDLFILNLDSLGNFNWAQSTLSSTADEMVNAVCQDGNGNIFITGEYSGNCTFETPTGYNSVQPTGSYHDALIAALDIDGNYLWSKSISGISQNTEIGMDIEISDDSELYLTGSFWNIVDFDPGPDTVYNSSPANMADVFTLILEACNCQDTILVVNTCEAYEWVDGNAYNTSTNLPSWVVSNATGCDSVIVLNLTIIDIDSTVTQINDTTLQSNAIGADYQWITLIPGVGYQILQGETNQTFSTSIEGLYFVITSSGICSDTSNYYMINTTNTLSIDFSDRIDLYPNPTKGKVVILTEIVVPDIINVFDPVGRLVSTIRPLNKNIDLSELTQGSYFVQLRWKDREITRTLVIE